MTGYEALKDRLNKLEQDLRKAEEERHLAMSMVNDFQAAVNTAESRRQSLEKLNTVCYI